MFQGPTLDFFFITHALHSLYTTTLKTYLPRICVGSENVFKSLFIQDNSKEYSTHSSPIYKARHNDSNFPQYTSALNLLENQTFIQPRLSPLPRAEMRPCSKATPPGVHQTPPPHLLRNSTGACFLPSSAQSTFTLYWIIPVSTQHVLLFLPT